MGSVQDYISLIRLVVIERLTLHCEVNQQTTTFRVLGVLQNG